MSEQQAGGEIQEIVALCEAAQRLPHGLPKIAILEQAVRRADVLNNAALRFGVRERLIEAATFGGRHEVAIVAYSWCLAESDTHPGRYDQRSLLWKYKWIFSAMGDFPQLTRQQIAAAAVDFESRILRAGFSQHALESCLFRLALKTGVPAAAREAFDRLQRCPRDALSDCPACVQDLIVGMFAANGEPAQSVDAAEAILAGRLRCSEVPHLTLGTLLIPLFDLDRLDAAADCHRDGYRLVARNPEFLEEIAKHILFLGLTKNESRGLQLMEKYMAMALEATNPRWRFEFFRSSLFILRIVERERDSVKLRLPPTAPFARDDGNYSVAALREWFLESATQLAAQFDQRNENTWLRDRLEELHELLTRIRPYSLAEKPTAGQTID